MTINAAAAKLEQIPVDKIEPNAENPRLYFRPKEMEELLESIHQYGVQVPISVFRRGKTYVLIDGERRWKCASKLNMRTIPALVQDEPSRLDNILLMFNIHALREQWDLLTIALKLKDVIALLEEEAGSRPTEAAIARKTGLSRGVVRRCRYLLDLPDEYRQVILDELEKPKQQQRFTEDFFIEMERSLRTVERAMPEVLRDKDEIRRTLMAKFEADVVPNRVHFRMLGKIARASHVNADEDRARSALNRVFADNTYSIERAFHDSVSAAYLERDTGTRIKSLIEFLAALEERDIDDDIRDELRALRKEIQRLLGIG